MLHILMICGVWTWEGSLLAFLLLLIEEVLLDLELFVNQVLVALPNVPRNQDLVEDEVGLGQRKVPCGS